MATNHEDSNTQAHDPNMRMQIIVAGGMRSNTAEAYMENGVWQILPQPMRDVRRAASSVVYGRRMIVTGGSRARNNVEELNLADPNAGWIVSPIALPFQELYGHVCLRYQNRLLVIGGRSDNVRVRPANNDEDRPANNDEDHPVNNDGFNTIYEIQLRPALMPRPIRYHGAVTIYGKIFIIGGTEGQTPCSNVLMFNPQANQQANPFVELNRLPFPVTQTATIVWNNCAVVLGGIDDEDNVRNTAILYDVKATTATGYGVSKRLPNMTWERYGCTAVTIGDDIIVMGGMNNRGTELDSVERYIAKRKKWMELPPMNEPRGHATAVRCNIPLHT